MITTLAIIGASFGQRPLYLKARELGFRTLGFAWAEGALCKDLADRFYPVSITETDRIADICRKEGVTGVVSNGSDITAEAVSKISTILGLPGLPYGSFLAIKDKLSVRELTRDIEGLRSPWFYRYDGQMPRSFPCVVKPCAGSAKKGVSYVAEPADFPTAVRYAEDPSDGNVLVEEFIPGREISVECLSFRGLHEIIQITDKDSTGPPHFVETGHHQPSTLPAETQDTLKGIVRRILTRLRFDNGASHIELKVTEEGDICLIEVNPRGGGDEIANQLILLSTGHDYVASIIRIAVGQFEPGEIQTTACSGIYYLCRQTSHLLPLFSHSEGKSWLVCKEIYEEGLREATTSFDRNAYLIYASDHRIMPTE